MTKKGQLLIESLVAISVLIIGFLGIFGLLSRSLSLNNVISSQYIASNLAAEGIEVVKNLIDANFIQNLPWNSGITDGSYGVSFNSTSLNDLQDQFLNLTPNNLYSYEAGQPTPYKRDIVIVNKGDEIQVNSIVTWQIRGGSYSITLEDHFFNWRPQ
jgi:type II secretory pathway pseudopilin PulG